jgi:CubicO group peptidase (beta-lactamase class C family)
MEETMADAYPMPSADPQSLGLAAGPLQHLDRLIRRHLEEGRYPGAQIALARHGKLALFRSYGETVIEPARKPATAGTLFLLFSQTKMLTSAAVWALVEEGRLSFMDRIADHLPEFASRGKAEITLHQVMTHQGGFPSGDVSRAAWADHARMCAEVCDFSLDWTPGTRLQYHPRAAHLVQAMLIEAVTGEDYRQVIREKVLAPLGLADDIFVGVPPEAQERCANTYAAETRDNSAEFKAAGLPSGGGYATARGMAAFYQMLLGQGRLGAVRLFSPRLIAYVSRNHTGDRPDEAMAGIAMHRGLGPHVRGDSDRIRGLGTLAAPATFGHGGAGTSYSWADPASGVSFSYLTNHVQPDPWHSARLDRVSNLVHAAID